MTILDLDVAEMTGLARSLLMLARETFPHSVAVRSEMFLDLSMWLVEQFGPAAFPTLSYALEGAVAREGSWTYAGDAGRTILFFETEEQIMMLRLTFPEAAAP